MRWPILAIVACTAAPALQSAPPPNRVDDRWYTIGMPIGPGAMQPMMINGVPHLSLLGKGGIRWYLLVDDGAGDLKTVMSVPTNAGGGATAHTVGQFVGSAVPDVAISSPQGILLIDVDTQRVRQIAVPGQGEIESLATGDVDGNGFDEIVIHRDASRTSNSLRVFSPRSGTILWTVDSDAEEVLVANVDDDPELEVITEDAVYDAATGLLETNLPGSSDDRVATPDLDGDGIHEVVLGEDYTYDLRVVDVVASSVTTHISPIPIWMLGAGDLDSNGSQELLIGGTAGEVAALQNLGLQTRWTVRTAPGNIRDVTVADLDGDGDVEVYGGNAQINRIDQGALTWSNRGDMRWSGSELADIDGDGTEELLIGGYSAVLANGGRVAAFDVSSRQLEQELQPTTVAGAPLATTWLTAGDLDADGAAEVYLAGIAGFFVHYVQGWTLDGPPQRTFELIFPNGVRALATTDYLGDGSLDLLVGSGDGLLVVDQTGATIDQFFVGQDIYDIVLDDLDQDGNTEAVVRVLPDQIVIVDLVTGTVEQTIQKRVEAITAGDGQLVMSGESRGLEIWSWNGSWPMVQTATWDDGEAVNSLSMAFPGFAFLGRGNALQLMRLSDQRIRWATQSYLPDRRANARYFPALNEVWNTHFDGIDIITAR